MNIEKKDLKVKSNNKLSKLKLGDITASGWLLEQLKREAEGLGGNLDILEPNVIKEPFVSKKYEKKFDENVAVAWCSEISASYWIGFIQLAFTLDDKKLKDKAADWVKGVLLNQEEDGYIGSYRKTDNRNEDWNAWGISDLVCALLSYYEVTGEERILEACHKGLLWVVENWDYRGNDNAAPMIIGQMSHVFLYTGDKRLLNWAEEYMDWHNKNSNHLNTVPSFLSNDLPYNSLHSVLLAMIAVVPAILFCSNGNKRYLKSSENAIQKLIDKNMLQRTGAPSSNFEYLGPIGSICETEYCCFSIYANTFSWMVMITGKPKYADLLEKIVFNGAQGGRKKDEKAIAYMTSPNQIFATSSSSIFGGLPDVEVYAPVFSVPCCSANSVRVIPEYVRSMCMTGEKDDIYFICYGPCNITLNPNSDTEIKIKETTSYPFSERIEFKIDMNKPAVLNMNFRIPEWCEKAEIKINGAEAKGEKTKGQYFSIKRSWSDNDEITIVFNMDTKLVKIEDSDFGNKNPVAIERGPLLFSLPIKEKWKTIQGRPLNELPNGWSWYEVTPAVYDCYTMEKGWEMHERYKTTDWNYALDIKKLGDPSDIEVVYEEDREYPWEKSPIKLRVPARKMKYGYSPYPIKTTEVYENPVETDEELEMIELVPYGCTALRISYFPIVKSKQ